MSDDQDEEAKRLRGLMSHAMSGEELNEVRFAYDLGADGRAAVKRIAQEEKHVMAAVHVVRWVQHTSWVILRLGALLGASSAIVAAILWIMERFNG